MILYLYASTSTVLVSKEKRERYLIVMKVVEDCSETDGVHSAGTKAKLSIYLSIYIWTVPVTVTFGKKKKIFIMTPIF